jgi:hypothetical protein
VDIGTDDRKFKGVGVSTVPFSRMLSRFPYS